MESFNLLLNISWFLLIILGTRTGLFLVLSYYHYHKNRRVMGGVIDYNPRVSVIVPCYNEEKVLENCVNSLLKQDYKNMDIIIVDDGSTDKTKKIGLELERRNKEKVKFLSKLNGGKASALNHGVLRSSGEIIICIDADSIFLDDTVTKLAKPFFDKNISAVAGNVKVANRNKLINKHQAIEYISGLNLQRRTFAILGCPQVISGAIGAFRKNKLIEVGGYSEETIVEDMDVTISLLEKGGRIVFEGKAIAYTEAPETLTDFIKQRYRWTFGGFQVLKKHKHLIFNPRFKSLGILGIPYFLLFPWVDVTVSFIFFIYLMGALISLNIITIVIYYFVFCLIQILLLSYSIYIDKEDKKLALLSLLEGLWYNHLITYITLKAGINFIIGSKVSWNKLNRLGKNTLSNPIKESLSY